RTRDQVVTAFSSQLRLSIVNLTKAANVAKVKHGLSAHEASLLGKMMAGVTLCASFLTDEERIAAQIKCDNRNPNVIYAEAIQVGEVRGYISNRDVTIQNSQSVDRPEGTLNFSKVLYGLQKPIESIVPMNDYSISGEFDNYFSLSEQIPSVIALEHSLGHDNGVQFNGGLLVQSLPSTPTSIIDAVRANVQKYNIEQLLSDEKRSLEDILRLMAPHEIEIIGSTFVDFFCR
ncbi:hypothetical protein SAMD00019534_119770, partial [Acytostelium subglobosum LB1]|uniref:hypothetical protein n=1 Tax=Acytostelium subglobosum LB1 TaxID=1410327 RepID=UPI00064488F6